MQERFDRFTSAISAISQGIRKIKTIEMKRLGLRSGHVECLYLLADYPEGLTPTQIAELSEMDKAAVSRYMDQLEEKGFAYLDESDSKKYKRRWLLTDKGSQTANHVTLRIDDAVNAVGSFMDDKERRALYASLEQIEENLQAYIKTREQ